MPATDPRRGMVLLIVLWSIALLAALAMAASVTFRSFTGIVAIDRDRIKTGALLTAGMEIAAGRLAASSELVADAEDTTVALSEGSVRLRMRDEGGRIDVGKAPEEVLISLLRFVGAPDAQELARNIVRWRNAGTAGVSPTPQGPTPPAPPSPTSSPAQGPAPPTPAAPASQPPQANATAAPFTDIRLLGRVEGMTPDVLAALTPLTTVFGSATVNPLTASADVLAALPGMDRERAAAILDARSRSADPARLQPILAPIQQYVQQKPLQAVSVELSAKLTDGFRAAARAVIIHLPDDSEPYRVLSWTPLPRT